LTDAIADIHFCDKNQFAPSGNSTSVINTARPLNYFDLSVYNPYKNIPFIDLSF
jgi:hypothetical protein